MSCTLRPHTPMASCSLEAGTVTSMRSTLEPELMNGVVYTGCRDSNLYALDAATGKEKWHFSNDGSWVISSPAVTRGKVIFGTSDSSLYFVLDAETGKPIVKRQDKAYIFSSPTVAGDLVFIGILNGTLQARDLDSG